jgi:hypothetical protein
MVGTLRYKTEGSGFDSWWVHRICFKWPSPSSCNMALRLPQCIMNLRGGKVRPSVSRFSRKLDSIDISQSYRIHGLLQGPIWTETCCERNSKNIFMSMCDVTSSIFACKHYKQDSTLLHIYWKLNSRFLNTNRCTRWTARSAITS